MPPPSDFHVIRLRDPWERIDPAENSAGAVESRQVPAIRFQRRFGLPSNLQAGDQVDLVLEECFAPGTISLNGLLLGNFSVGQKPVAFPVQDYLQQRNTLLIELQPNTRKSSTNFSDLVRHVRLEIRSISSGTKP